MKKLFTTAIFFLTINSFSQTYTSNYIFRGKDYSLKSERQESGAYKITLEESADNKSDFTINPLKLETFDVAFQRNLSLLLPLPLANQTITSVESKELSVITKNLFFNIVAESLKENLSEAPVSGKLTISKNIAIYNSVGDKQQEGVAPQKVTITDVQIEFLEGYIETIKVNGVDAGKNYRFENQYGIGFSIRKNYYTLGETKLYDFKEKKYIIVGDLLDYDYEVKPLTRDYSPGNQVLYSYGGQKIELHKDETSKLLEVIIYSDFIGIDKDKPNGLIQTELAKRVNLYSSRIQTSAKMRWLSNGFGFFQYIRPAVTLSKIEENNRFLIPHSNDSILKTSTGQDSSLITGIAVSPIEVMNYQNVSLGVDLNILFLDNTDMKYNFYLNGGFRFLRTAISDSLRTLNSENDIENTGLVNNFGISYFTFYPEAIIQFLPEERFGFSISDKLQYFKSAFTEPKLISYDKENKIEQNYTKWINSLEIMAYVKTGENGKIFGRWRFNSQLGNLNVSYHQIQVGYSFYLLKKR